PTHLLHSFPTRRSSDLEFQDTDPCQWEILRRLFLEGSTYLLLVGDPKQAIYGFRQADIYTYLSAARHFDAKYSLGINFRSQAMRSEEHTSELQSPCNLV